MTRVLIVDDDRDHAESLVDVIEMRGHATQLAHTGEEAIKCFRAADFDFVLLDVKLPGIDGVATFLELKKIQPAARVMMMTGYSVEHFVGRAIEAGALGVLHKPFAATKVLELLSTVKQQSRVLVADADAASVDSVASVLDKAGYRVDTAASGAETLEKIEHARVDCLLLDLSLPVLSGAETCARLVDASRTVPTVLMTGSRESIEEDAPIRSRICGMLAKPIDPHALLAMIESAVSRGQAR